MQKIDCCPKCKSQDLIFIPSKAGMYGTGNNIMVDVTLSIAIRVHRFVCGRCGYSEEWIDQEDIRKLKQYFSSKKTESD